MALKTKRTWAQVQGVDSKDQRNMGDSNPDDAADGNPIRSFYEQQNRAFQTLPSIQLIPDSASTSDIHPGSISPQFLDVLANFEAGRLNYCTWTQSQLFRCNPGQLLHNTITLIGPALESASDHLKSAKDRLDYHFRLYYADKTPVRAPNFPEPSASQQKGSPQKDFAARYRLKDRTVIDELQQY
ncbi:hypothetical protein C8R44DRAFT_755024 [Mycena epipterygia]|nr:hypothetical protein C8R44DRAFT_755024 [Mycena epipterygia]